MPDRLAAPPDLSIEYEVAAEDQPLEAGSLSVAGSDLLRDLARANGLDWG